MSPVRTVVKKALAKVGLLSAAKTARRDVRERVMRARLRAAGRDTRARREEVLAAHPELRAVSVRVLSGSKWMTLDVVARTRADPSVVVAAEANRDIVVDLLTAGDVPYLDLPIDSVNRYRVAVRECDAAGVLRALAADARPSTYVYFDGGSVSALQRIRHVATTPVEELVSIAERTHVVRVFDYWASPDGRDVLGDLHGCEVEAWRLDEERDVFVPRRANRMVASLPAASFDNGSVPAQLRRDTAPALSADVRFPIDVVYTWVDGSDPRWQERRDAALGRVTKQDEAPDLHPEAASDARYLSRDELRYSLRSIEKYADFVRHVYVVTDQQCPPWLRTDHPRLTLVDHRDIFDDHTALPTFNSHSIEARLHHVPGLAEHYIYMNDDFLFLRRVGPARFFASNGAANIFPSRALMPLGAASSSVKPVDAAAMNGRDLVLAHFGSMPTFKFKHTPYSQRRSVHLAIEEIFADAVRRTVHSRVRSATDLALASSLHHHVAYAMGEAIVGRIDSVYVDLGGVNLGRDLARLSRQRSWDALCLNDTDSEVRTEEEKNLIVRDFLDAYFPERSSFEVDVEVEDAGRATAG